MPHDLDLIVMAGPCSAESENQIMRIAEKVKKEGASYFRAGAWKPRTKGGDWEGNKTPGLKWLQKAKSEFDLKIVTEILGPADSNMTFQQAIDLFLESGVDLFQVGARNAQNQELLNALGKANVPVLLKNGMNTTLNEWYGSATRIAEGKAMMCVRGKNNEIDIARNGQDMTTVAKLVNDKKYPIIFDPSHIAGKRELVYDITIGAVAMGVNGIIAEVHYDPIASRTDSRQAITPEQFRHLVKSAYESRQIYLEQIATKNKFLDASIPQHVDIYFLPSSHNELNQVLGAVSSKKYLPKKKTEISCARVPSNSLQKLKRAGFNVGEMFYYDKEDKNLSEGVELRTNEGKFIHISPYSKEALDYTKQELGSRSKGRQRIEYVNRWPGERIRDAFLTVEMRLPQLSLDRLVLARKFEEL